MTGDARPENDTSPAPGGGLEERIAQLCTDDEQIRAAIPKPEVVDAARRPGLRLPQVLETYVEGYADRPALGWRTRTLTTDPTTGRTASQLLPRFETITYRDLWANVRAAATAWRHDPDYPVAPGDFVATVGFASPDYLTIDLVCGYLGLVAVPLQHNAPVSRLRPIIDEVEPRVLAVSAAYLDLAIESALGSQSARRIVVFDYQPEVDDQRESLRAGTGATGGRRYAGGRRDARRRHRPRPCVAAGTRVPRRRRPATGHDHVHVGKHRAAQGGDVHRGHGVSSLDRRCDANDRGTGGQRQLHATEPPWRTAPAGNVVPGRRHQFLCAGKRFIHAVRGLESGAAHRDGAGATGGRNVVPALPKRG